MPLLQQYLNFTADLCQITLSFSMLSLKSALPAVSKVFIKSYFGLKDFK